MQLPELSRLAERAAYLLRMMARYDVEGLSDQRYLVLRRLRELETRAAELGMTDLYEHVLRSGALRSLQWSYEEG